VRYYLSTIKIPKAKKKLFLGLRNLTVRGPSGFSRLESSTALIEGALIIVEEARHTVRLLPV
jgi:hypothetical protein